MPADRIRHQLRDACPKRVLECLSTVARGHRGVSQPLSEWDELGLDLLVRGERGRPFLVGCFLLLGGSDDAH
jgi:hypothetical protein